VKVTRLTLGDLLVCFELLSRRSAVGEPEISPGPRREACPFDGSERDVPRRDADIEARAVARPSDGQAEVSRRHIKP
jgi:hypothetical protein